VDCGLWTADRPAPGKANPSKSDLSQPNQGEIEKDILEVQSRASAKPAETDRSPCLQDTTPWRTLPFALPGKNDCQNDCQTHRDG
jgi:hypothetical protein